MFCQKCGTQNADYATFCFKCGGKLIVIVQAEIKQTIEKPTFIKSNDSKRIEKVKKEEIKANQEPKKKGSGWKTLFFIIIGLALLGAISNTNTVSPDVITSTVTPTVSSQVITSTLTPTPLPTSIFVTPSPLQMLPTINDMPEGAIKGSETANDTYATRDFIFTGFATQRLNYKVSKFSSIDKAIDKYNSIINTYSNYKLTNVNLGDESIGFELANTLATVVFRKANTVIEVQIAGQYTTNLDDTISYAKMVNIPTSTQV